MFESACAATIALVPALIRLRKVSKSKAGIAGGRRERGSNPANLETLLRISATQDHRRTRSSGQGAIAQDFLPRQGRQPGDGGGLRKETSRFGNLGLSFPKPERKAASCARIEAFRAALDCPQIFRRENSRCRSVSIENSREAKCALFVVPADRLRAFWRRRCDDGGYQVGSGKTLGGSRSPSLDDVFLDYFASRDGARDPPPFSAL